MQQQTKNLYRIGEQFNQRYVQEIAMMTSGRGENRGIARASLTISQKEYMEPVKAVVYGFCRVWLLAVTVRKRGYRRNDQLRIHNSESFPTHSEVLASEACRTS